MKRRAAALEGNALSAEVAGLSKASIKDLRERWKRLYGNEPSGHIGRSLLIGRSPTASRKERSAVSSRPRSGSLTVFAMAAKRLVRRELRNGGSVQGPF